MARNGIIRQHVPTTGEIRPPRPPPPPLVAPPAQRPRERPPASRPAPRATEEVHYPDSDGHFLMQNDKHSLELIYASQAIEQHLHTERFKMMVDAFLYYEEGNPAARVGPDLLVTLQHEFRGEGVYKTWVEGRPPDFVLEVVSPSSIENDYKLKPGKYAGMGVKEYFIYDPDLRKEGAQVLGYQLDEATGTYADPLPAAPDGSVRSALLGVSLRRADTRLVLRNEATGEDYQPTRKLRKMFEQAEARAKEAEAKAREAEAKAERLQEEKRLEARAKEWAEHRAEEAEAKAARLAEEKAIESRFRISAEEEIKRLKQQVLDLQRPKRRNTYYGR